MALAQALAGWLDRASRSPLSTYQLLRCRQQLQPQQQRACQPNKTTTRSGCSRTYSSCSQTQQAALTSFTTVKVGSVCGLWDIMRHAWQVEPLLCAPVTTSSGVATADESRPHQSCSWLVLLLLTLQKHYFCPLHLHNHTHTQQCSLHLVTVYHVLIRDQAQQHQQLPALLFNLLNPGGTLMILAGNSNEPEVGPNVLTAEHLLQPLLSAGFEVVLLHQTRFDSTQHYSNVLGMRPLAWWVVLQRPA